MAHASGTRAHRSQYVQRNDKTGKDLQRNLSYSDYFHSGCVRTLTSDLSEFVAEFKNCLCHKNDSRCPVSKERHQILGQMLHLFQNACGSIGPAGSYSLQRNSLTRQQSVDSSRFQGVPILTNRSSSEQSEGGYSSQSSIDSFTTCSYNNEPCFVIKKGYLLIINNVWFNGMCCPRNGTKAEGQRMQGLFESFGFDVHLKFNCSSYGIREILKEKTRDSCMNDYDCFALLILSHGTEDGILCVDRREISYQEIMNMLKVDEFPAMGGRPKLIFSQACRGVTYDEGQLLSRGGSDICRDCHDDRALPQTVLRVPTDSDILIVYATTPGRMAYKNIEYSTNSDSDAHSWFLEALSQVFPAHAHEDDLLSMLTRVNSHVAMLGNKDMGMQIPSQFSTLTRKVFLKRR